MANEFKVKLASSCSRCSLSGWWGESPPSVEGNRLSDGWEDCAEKEAWASFTYTPTKKEENIVKKQSQLLSRKSALRVIVADGLEDGERASWVTGGAKSRWGTSRPQRSQGERHDSAASCSKTTRLTRWSLLSKRFYRWESCPLWEGGPLRPNEPKGV